MPTFGKSLAFALSLVTLGGVVFNESARSAPAQSSDSCPASTASQTRNQPSPGAATAANETQAGPDARGAPRPTLTISGSNQVLASPCPSAAPAATRARKTRSNIQNN